jgi:hypothetical protein
MTRHEAEALVLQRGEAKPLPHTLSETRHLTLALIDTDPAAGTATFELHNPEAQPDERVGDLVEEAVEDAEASNEWRDKLHLPEKPVPVDTSTVTTEQLDCRLHEKLQIGDRVWAVTDIAADRVTLTPGRDHEADTLSNKIEDVGYEGPGVNAAEALNTIDDAF